MYNSRGRLMVDLSLKEAQRQECNELSRVSHELTQRFSCNDDFISTTSKTVDKLIAVPATETEVYSNMPRVYKPDPTGKRYKKYSQELINEAVEAYKTSNESLKAIAEKYKIDKSVLYRNCTRTLKKQGGQTVLSEDVELYMIRYINLCADWGYPFDGLDLRYMVKGYLDRLGRMVLKFKNNLPGPEFVRSFLQRHKNRISERFSQNIKRNRAGVTPENIKKYFEELEKSLTGIEPANIINYDETNLTDDPGRKKILVKRGTKYPERVMNHSKASTSIMMAAAADGSLLPPYVVYKAQNLYDSWTVNGPVAARYNRTESGWFNADMFEDWIKTIILPYFENTPGKKILIGDNLASHISFEVIEICDKHNIHFAFLPANSTHLTQPLDVAFFRPMKIAWRNIMLKWKKTDGKQHTSIPKGCFPSLLKKLMDDLNDNSKNNVISGFRKTGIHPIDANQVLSRLPKEENLENDRDAIDKSVLDLLKEMRYGSINVSEPKIKKKLDVIPGQSVGTDTWDYIETEEESSHEKKRKITSRLNKNKQTKEENVKNKGKGKGKKTKILNQEKNNEEIVNKTEEKLNKKNKGKGNGKETKILDQEICDKENETVNTTKTITSNSTYKLDYLEGDALEKMPIYFEDDLFYGEEIILAEIPLNTYQDKAREKKESEEEARRSMVKIISNEKLSDNCIKNKVTLNKCRKIPVSARLTVTEDTINKHQPSTSGLHTVAGRRRPSYYRNEDEILKDVMDDNFMDDEENNLLG